MCLSRQSYVLGARNTLGQSPSSADVYLHATYNRPTLKRGIREIGVIQAAYAFSHSVSASVKRLIEIQADVGAAFVAVGGGKESILLI